MKILKSRWYLVEKIEDHYAVLTQYGPFHTYCQAMDITYQKCSTQDPTRPSQILVERKPNWKDRTFTAVRGTRILTHKIYHMPKDDRKGGISDGQSATRYQNPRALWRI